MRQIAGTMVVLPIVATTLVGLCLALLLALAVTHRELLRRAFLCAEDPRAMGVLRIAFTTVAIVGVLEPVLDATWLFSDEGLLLREASHGQAAAAIAGVHVGHVDAGWHYLTAGNASLLHFLDTPAFVRAYCAVLLLGLLGLLLGLRTRACAWLVLVLYLGLLHRDDLWSGGEQVYCAGFFLLAVSRCGHAYSLDNWLRCRALRSRGLLSLPGGPGDGAGTPALAAIYRRIPAWPRLLVVAQVALAYGLNGLNKIGRGWWNGTDLFYVLQCDWARFDARPLALWLGTDLIAWATWFVRAWETLFPLVVLGLVLRFVDRERLPPTRGARPLWLAFAVVTTFLAAALTAVHPQLDVFPDMPGWVFLTFALSWLGLFMRRKLPACLTLVLARRVWVTGAVFFTLGLVVTLNVGVFPLATLTFTLALFRGEEIAAALGRLRRRPPIPCEDQTLPHLHHDDATLPPAILIAVTVLLFIAATALLLGAPPWTWRWAVLVAALMLLARPRPCVREDSTCAPWAYGPLGRLLCGSACAVHLTAYIMCAMPSWPQLADLRQELRRPTRWWLDFTGNYQFWEMFAHSGSHNYALETRVRDADGQDIVTTTHLPLDTVTFWNSRQSKVDANTMYRKRAHLWHARAVCRRFAREHAGRTPQEVGFTMLTAPILPPWRDADPDRLARFTAAATRSPILTVDCRSEPHAQLPDEHRRRLGFAPDVPFVSTSTPDWQDARDKQGPLWPYDEWFALLGLAVLLRRLRVAP